MHSASKGVNSSSVGLCFFVATYRNDLISVKKGGHKKIIGHQKNTDLQNVFGIFPFLESMEICSFLFFWSPIAVGLTEGKQKNWEHSFCRKKQKHRARRVEEVRLISQAVTLCSFSSFQIPADTSNIHRKA